MPNDASQSLLAFCSLPSARRWVLDAGPARDSRRDVQSVSRAACALRAIEFGAPP